MFFLSIFLFSDHILISCFHILIFLLFIFWSLYIRCFDRLQLFFFSFFFHSPLFRCPFPRASFLPSSTLIPNSFPFIPLPLLSSPTPPFSSLPFPAYCLLTSSLLRNSGLFSLLSLGSLPFERQGGKGRGREHRGAGRRGRRMCLYQ